MQITVSLIPPRGKHINDISIADEIPAVLNLLKALLDEIMEIMQEHYFEFDQQQALVQAEKLIAEQKYFALMAYDQNTSVGFIKAYESYALYAQGSYGTLPECYVIPEYRSNGVGKALLDAMFNFAADKNWHRLEVTTPPLPEFDGALRFYQQNGFEIAGGRKLKISL